MKRKVAALKSDKLKAHINAHCKPIAVRQKNWFGRYEPVEGFHEVVKPMYVFKKLHTVNTESYHSVDTIANLVIPVGAIIFVHPGAFMTSVDSDSRKMRASEVFVHSIAKKRTGKQVKEATSSWDPKFTYRVGKTVTPNKKFSKHPSQCDSGIHFFVNLCDAKSWG